jgi:hypothetical protein
MTTPTAQSLLTYDLRTRSAGSPGRVLLVLLEHYCLDLLGATRPLEFAVRLQRADPTARHVLEELLEWTAQEPEFQLVALTALAPGLDQVARRLGNGRPSADTVSEVLAQASQALVWTHELVEGERADFVRRHAFIASKREQRRMVRHNMPADSIPDNFDRVHESSTSDVAEVVRDRLGIAEECGAISPDERRLIEVTRSGNRSLRAVADASPLGYETLRFRRARAERRLRSFYGLGVNR